MASKKLRPGSFKGGKSPVRRTGRTTGISQSAFAGYGFQTNQQSNQEPLAEPAEPVPKNVSEEAPDDASALESADTKNDRADNVSAEATKRQADKSEGCSD